MFLSIRFDESPIGEIQTSYCPSVVSHGVSKWLASKALSTSRRKMLLNL